MSDFWIFTINCLPEQSSISLVALASLPLHQSLEQTILSNLHTSYQLMVSQAFASYKEMKNSLLT